MFTQLSGTLIDDAHKALKNKNIQKAIKLYKQSARNGNDEAIFELGKIYYNGKYVKKDINKAMKYFKQIASYDHLKAKYNVATIYAQKTYEKHDYKKAYNIFLDLAKSGEGKAQNNIGIFLLYGLGVDKDYKLALRWFEQSYFESKYKPAVCNLAIMFVNGYGAFPNFGRAAKLARVGIKDNIPACKKVYEEFNLHKYKEDKSFKFGYYK